MHPYTNEVKTEALSSRESILADVISIIRARDSYLGRCEVIEAVGFLVTYGRPDDVFRFD